MKVCFDLFIVKFVLIYRVLSLNTWIAFNTDTLSSLISFCIIHVSHLIKLRLRYPRIFPKKKNKNLENTCFLG